MGTWVFEPGHTAAMFRARHMMVTYVRGHFENVSGSLVFDPENPAQSSADVAIDAAAIWTGQPQRDAHLRSADFLDVENHPRITFKGNQVKVAGARGRADLDDGASARGEIRGRRTAGSHSGRQCGLP
jgi:polyisoprenoid-binding protein YceI